MNEVVNRLRELGIVLPPLPEAVGNYELFVITGDLLFTTVHPGKSPEGKWYAGQVGTDVSTAEAYQYARLSTLRMLAIAQSALGSLDRVERVVRITGFVNSAPHFKSHPQVLDGCSDLLIQVFGEAGRHTRSAVGASSLPENVTVELEATFKIR